MNLSVIERFLKTETGRKIAEEAAAEAERERKTQIETLAQHNAATEKEIHRLLTSEGEIEKKVRDAENKLREAVVVLRQAQTARHNAQHRAERTRTEIETSLKASAPAILQETAAKWRAEANEVRRTRITVEVVRDELGRIPRNRKGDATQLSNKPCIVARVFALEEAARQAEGLALSVANETEAQASLDAIYAMVPEIGKPVEVDFNLEPLEAK